MPAPIPDRVVEFAGQSSHAFSLNGFLAPNTMCFNQLDVNAVFSPWNVDEGAKIVFLAAFK